MAEYLRNFVTGHNINFETNKRNLTAFVKAKDLWQDIWSAIEPNGQSIIIVAGAKNNGKSSLIRYLINTYNRTNTSSRENYVTQDDKSNATASDGLVMIDERNEAEEHDLKLQDQDVYAYLVDFDPGQAELTCSGIISAHIIKAKAAPLQSPTYLNMCQHESIVMSSIGGTNMAVNPRLYIDNVRFIFDSVIKHRNSQSVKRPIFVNTMGYIRNVGLAMLIDLIKICSPTNLVILNVETDPMRTIYADLSPNALINTRASFYYETNHQYQRKLDYKYDLHNLDFCFVDSSSVATKNRIALQLAYMATIPEAIYKPIMQISAKWISLKKVSIYCVSSYPLKEMIVLEILQHSWIHLVKLKHSSIQDVSSTSAATSDESDSSICKILEDVSENILLGCGIVADIDLEKKLVAVITPLDQTILDENVDCIVKPLSIQVPHQILQENY